MITHTRQPVTRYTISVGLNDKDENIQKFQTERILRLVTNCCKAHDLSFSCYNQKGGYKPEKGGYVLEDSIAIVLNDPVESMVDELCGDLCVVCATMSYQMPTNNGIIKGGGDSGFVVKMDFISIWCVVVPVSLVMAFLVKASPTAVVCCLNADQVFKCIPAFLHARSGKWIKKLT